MSGVDEMLYGSAEDRLETLHDQVKSLRDWLLEHQAQYDEMVANWTSLEWLQSGMVLLSGVNDAIGRHQPEDPPHQAVYLLAQARSSLDSVATQVEFMADFEQRREAYHAVISRFREEQKG